MTHPVRTRTDSAWTFFPTVSAASFADLDSKLFDAINGDDGGTWALQNPTTINNAGGGGLLVTGGTLIQGVPEQPATLTIGTGGVLSIVSATEFQRLAPNHVGRTRQIVQNFWTANLTTQGHGATRFFRRTLGAYGFGGDTGVGVQSFALTFTPDTGASFSPEFWYPLRVHDGATFSQTTFCFRVWTPRTTGPVTMPKFRIMRRDGSGNMVALKSTAVDALGFAADANGFASPTKPTSGAAWYLGGAPQDFVYVCNQNNVIDKSQYSYWAHVVEEGGATKAPLQLQIKAPCVAVATSNVNLASVTGTNADGVSIINGQRLLCVGQTNPTENGIWFFNGAGWSRESDLSLSSQFVLGMVVPVTGGQDFQSSLWQFYSPGTFTLGTTAALFSQAEYLPNETTGNGNVYHSALTQFTNIVDTRWQ